MQVVACYIQSYRSITNTNTLNVTVAKHISTKNWSSSGLHAVNNNDDDDNNNNNNVGKTKE